MAKSTAERAKKYKQRKRSKGCRNISIYLEPEIATMLDNLKAYHNTTVAGVIARGIKLLANTTENTANLRAEGEKKHRKIRV